MALFLQEFDEIAAMATELAESECGARSSLFLPKMTMDRYGQLLARQDVAVHAGVAIGLKSFASQSVIKALKFVLQQSSEYFVWVYKC